MPKRLCKSKVNDAAPRRGGSVMLMLSVRSLATTMSQNCRFVLSPWPKSAAQATAGPAFDAAVVSWWAWRADGVATAPPHASTRSVRARTHADTCISRSILSDFMPAYPQRIICLTEETTETLYRLGAGDRVVGVSGCTARPPEARSKPKVSAFLSARIDKIVALRPDLILAFSDLQADIVSDLVRRGFAVMAFNQRRIADILQMIRQVGGLVGLQARAEQLAIELADGL